MLAFQEGLLSGLFSYTGPAAIEVTSLAFLFAVTFALATDYAVLVMARVKEQHDRGASNEEAVAVGISRTGRVIAEAAAVIVDTTIVRALLAPALMGLFGEWNWWAPGPLRRLQARFRFAADPRDYGVARVGR
ncbi:MAG TPA: MMPL family transporter [Solirubrobacteraceae bacterium]|nr:MMPL family transporter [Solirubrobacteraceae bacterium]